jgi:diguanylate cyclase (GGDEF)-like protein
VETLEAACALTETPDLILLDLTLPDAHGLETLHRLRERFAFVPVVLLTADEGSDVEAAVLQAGAQDFIGKDELTARTLRRVVRYSMERHHQQQDLDRLATRDEITGLFNRRGFLNAAEPLARSAERGDRTFLVFVVDLEGLNAINEAHGRAVGDAAIYDAAWILTHSFRSADIIGRIGPDEFAVLAPDAPPEALEIMIRRVGKWQSERNAQPNRVHEVSLAVGGVAWTPSEPRTLEMMLSEADMAAYAAKRR